LKGRGPGENKRTVGKKLGGNNDTITGTPGIDLQRRQGWGLNCGVPSFTRVKGSGRKEGKGFNNSEERRGKNIWGDKGRRAAEKGLFFNWITSPMAEEKGARHNRVGGDSFESTETV